MPRRVDLLKDLPVCLNTFLIESLLKTFSKDSLLALIGRDVVVDFSGLLECSLQKTWTFKSRETFKKVHS